MYAYRRTYEKTIYRFLTAFYKIKKIYFWPRGAPCSAGALGSGLAGLCLKTALGIVVTGKYYGQEVRGSNQSQNRNVDQVRPLSNSAMMKTLPCNASGKMRRWGRGLVNWSSAFIMPRLGNVGLVANRPTSYPCL